MKNNLKNFLNANQGKNSFRLLWLFIFLYTLFFSLISFWKYKNFLYNGLDLAIFNQVFFNTSEGRLFEFSIHPHLYLGDHFSLFILFLAPLYAFFKSPIFLLFLQSLILGLASWPIFLITKNVFKKQDDRFLIALTSALVFLLNPIIWNINLFDFHILSFAIFFLLFAFYFWQEKRFLWFVIFLILALTVREDVSLVVFMFGILPLLEIKNLKEAKFMSFPRRRESRRMDSRLRGNDIINYFRFFTIQKNNLKWIFSPIVMSLFWFFVSAKIISYFNPASSYKFLVYYQWLGKSNNFLDLILNIFKNPLAAFLHLFVFGNLVTFFGFLLSFIFFPLFAGKYLLLAIGVFVQIFLSSANEGDLILQTHYAALFLPALSIASIYGLKNFLEIRKKKIKKWELSKKDEIAIERKLVNFQGAFKIIVKEKNLLFVFFIVSIIYVNLFLGPTFGILKAITHQEIKEKTKLNRMFVKKIPDKAPVVTTYNLISNLSKRKDIYSLYYVFLGRKQFSQEEYKLPDNVKYYLIDFSDLITYQLQIENVGIYQGQYMTGDDRLREYLKNYGIVDVVDSLVLFKKNYQSDKELIEKENLPQNNYKDSVFLNNKKIALLSYNRKKFKEKRFKKSSLVFCSFLWRALENIKRNYQLQIEILDRSNKVVWQKIYPLAYGIYPTSEWKTNEAVRTNYWFLLPDKFLNDKFILQAKLIDIKKGHLGLNGIRSVVDKIEEKEELGTFEIK
ncbi:MAG: DUF2079 domain-containing protein [Xanthomonadaceae bacterium]|nr:DUF2079 domain-containing protein [Rhodospirillaceae bacterium]NIA18207.1 DUF2079 domain-containing protein [Xanthomonadaceae bacterium]